MYGIIKTDVREIINTLCQYKNVKIIAGAVCVNHVNLSVAISKRISISNFMGKLKKRSTLMIYDRCPKLQSKWDKAFGANSNNNPLRTDNKTSIEVVVANLHI